MTPPTLCILALYAPLTVAFIWANNRRRIAEREVARLVAQTIDLLAPPGLAPINEIEHRLALRKELRAQGFDLHRRRA